MRQVPGKRMHALVSTGWRWLTDSSYRQKEAEIRRLRRLPRYQAAQTDLLGMPIKLPDAHSFLYSFKEIFDNEIYAFQTANAKPYIIDCGTNIGLSILYFKQLYPTSQILAFEPDPEIYRLLRDNIKSLQLESVESHQQAVWSAETELSFAPEGADAGRIDTGGVARVLTKRLRDFLDRPVDFLKVDIEGAETEVLLDCADRLANVHNLFVEYHSFANCRQTLHQLLQTLDGAGFHVHIHSSNEARRPFLKRNNNLGMDMVLNIFAFREEKE